MDARGYITVNEDLTTNVPGIWALGDCNGRGAFTHTAYNDFEIVAANLLDGEHRELRDRVPAYALYIDPPLGRVGITEAQARASGRPLLIGKRPMSRVGRAVEKGETQGFMKVVVDADNQEDSRRGDSRHRRRRGDPRRPGYRQRGCSLRSASARRTDSSDRIRADPDAAGRDAGLTRRRRGLEENGHDGGGIGSTGRRIPRRRARTRGRQRSAELWYNYSAQTAGW